MDLVTAKIPNCLNPPVSSHNDAESQEELTPLAPHEASWKPTLCGFFWDSTLAHKLTFLKNVFSAKTVVAERNVYNRERPPSETPALRSMTFSLRGVFVARSLGVT